MAESSLLLREVEHCLCMQAAKGPKEPVDLKKLTVRQYLEATVVSVLLKGMQEVVKQRPDDPLEFLAQYLREHNPKKGSNADK